MPKSIRPDLYALFLLGAALLAASPPGGAYPYLLPVLALASFHAWLSALSRVRFFKDTPKSKIASAAQGYVELVGRAKCLPGEPVLSPLTGHRVAWYRLQTEKKEAGDWRTVRDTSSTKPFMIDDGTGVCAVDLSGASQFFRNKRTKRVGNVRHTEWRLEEGSPVYGIGAFETVEDFDLGRCDDEDVSARAHDILAQWKADQNDFVARFDRNSDGVIDQAEWQRAREEAHRFAASRGLAARPEEGIHVLRNPGDGRLFLVADFDQRQLNNTFDKAKWLFLVDVAVSLALLIHRYV